MDSKMLMVVKLRKYKVIIDCSNQIVKFDRYLGCLNIVFTEDRKHLSIQTLRNIAHGFLFNHQNKRLMWI